MCSEPGLSQTDAILAAVMSVASSSDPDAGLIFVEDLNR